MEQHLPTIHLVSVILFLVIYLVKTPLLLMNKTEALARVAKATKVPEMIVSLLFLVTGVWMMVMLPSINTMLIIKVVIVLLSIPIAIVGFKKRNKVLAALALLMIIGAYGLGEVSKKKREKGADVVVNEAAPKEDMGKSVYDAKCSNCHGGDGKLGIGGAKDLSASVMGDEEMKSVIVNGKGAMPPVSGLTPEQVDAVTAYVKSLKK